MNVLQLIENSRIARVPYLLWGVGLMLVKNGLDRFIAWYAFDRHWSFSNYFIPVETGNVATVSPTDANFFAALLITAFPFIWIGVILTLRRLRDAGLPTLLVMLFFVPAVNFLLFTLLVLIPSSSRTGEEPPLNDGEGRGDMHSILDRVIPSSSLGSAVVGVLVTVSFGLLITLISVEGMGRYGWGLFVGLPFVLGFASALIHGYHEQRTLKQCIGVAWMSIFVAAGVLLIFALEGILCILMAAPLCGVVATLGAVVGYVMQLSFHDSARKRSSALHGIAIGLPLLLSVEYVESSPAPLYAVKSVVEVNAPPEKVWKNVVSFSSLAEPKEFLFKAGIAYPKKATIIGQGVGACRHCVFSTGAFVEPIEVWDEPNLLKFSVLSNPAPMEEWTFYKTIRPPHLHGYLESKGGQFKLDPLPGGRTRLEGTTWYHHSLWPAAYWKLWSDDIIHRIHLRVLDHVKTLSEQPASVAETQP